MKKRNIKKRLISLFLAFSISLGLGGCSFSNNKNRKTKENSDITGETIGLYEEEDFWDEVQKAEEELKIKCDAKPSKATPSDGKKYSEEMSEVVVQYPHEEYYLSSEKIDSIVDQIENDCECPNNTSNTSQEIDILSDTIISNSQQYVNNPYFDKNFSDTYSDFLPNENNQKPFDLKVLLNKALHCVFDGTTNNFSEDFCLLSGYSVLISYDQNGMVYGEVISELHTIVIYYKTIEIYEEENLEEMVLTTLSHELEHVRQFKCKHRENDQTYSNISYLDDTTSTLVESSAESALYNYSSIDTAIDTDNYEFTYSCERRDESLLFLIGLTNPSINGYYDALFDTDLEALYKFFNLKTKDDIATFYKILYAIDSKNCRTYMPIKVIGKNEATIKELEDLAGQGYFVDIFRLTLQNLIDYTLSNPDFSLKDNLLLFSIAKNMIVGNNWSFEFTEDGNIYDPHFTEAMMELETMYVNFLSEVYGISVEEIRKIESSCCNENNVNDDLLNKFPVLEAILAANNIYFWNYEELSKSKSLRLTPVTNQFN